MVLKVWIFIYMYLNFIWLYPNSTAAGEGTHQRQEKRLERRIREKSEEKERD